MRVINELFDFIKIMGFAVLVMLTLSLYSLLAVAIVPLITGGVIALLLSAMAIWGLTSRGD